MSFNFNIQMALDLLNEQEPIKVSGKWVKELTGVSLGVEPGLIDSESIPISRKYAAAQLVWYCAAEPDLWIEPYNQEMWSRFDFEEDGLTIDMNSNYGVELFKKSQIHRCLRDLQQDRTTRRAVVILNRPEILSSSTQDHVCTTSLQFLVRNDELVLITTMRSNEFWDGLRYDSFFFGQLQSILAAVLGVRPGKHIHQVGSLHIYEAQWEKSKTTLTERMTEKIPKDLANLDIFEQLSRLKKGPEDSSRINHHYIPFVTHTSELIYL